MLVKSESFPQIYNKIKARAKPSLIRERTSDTWLRFVASYKFETIVETLPPTTLELGKDKQEEEAEFALSTSKRRFEIRQRNLFYKEMLRWFVGLLGISD